VTLAALRRRWPEAAVAVALVLVAVFTGLAWRALATVLLGALAAYAIRRRIRDVALAALLMVGLLVTSLVVSFTIDLGALTNGWLPGVAARAASKQIERPMHIGRFSIQIARGRFIIEGLRIDGVKPGDAPFFTAGRINLDFPWWQVFSTREFFIRSMEMSDWSMQIEKFAQGGNNMPRLRRDSKEPAGPKRFTTTLYYVHAYRGQFTYIDHGTWNTVARNLDIYVRHNTGKYVGTASITGGTTQIKDYLPMRSDMRVTFQVDDGGMVHLPEITLLTDGAESSVNGYVDFGHWPEMVYNVDSRVNLWRMREIFFANESWRSRGEARFKGVFHLFDGGHQLKGEFTSALAHVNQFAFPDLRGSLVWEPHRFEVTHATARFYDGVARFRYLMAPLSDPKPAVASWDVAYENVDLLQLSDALQMRGLRMLGRATGTNLLEWPLGEFSKRRGNGHFTIAAPDGRTILPRVAAAAEAEIHAEPPAYGPERNLNLFPPPTAIGGELTYRFDPEWVDVAPSHLGTERTYVEFQGRTAYGDRSQFPFYARSADWQESDRLLAGIITAFGSPTGVISVGGHGEFHGTMTKSFKDPLIQGTFAGDDMRAWDVVWGHATAGLSIENGYVDITRATVTRGASSVEADGRFSLGYPRKDGGEELNARFVIRDRPMRDLRHAFQLDEWPVEGKVSGEFRLYDKYTRPFGYGRLVVADATAWGEPFERATAPMRFEGQGVRLDAIEFKKSGETVTGAAYVGWDGSYSFNARGDRIPLESLASIKYGSTEWSGLMHFSVTGASTFQNPRYEVKMGAEDVFLGEEGIGVMAMSFDVKDRLLTIERLEASGLGLSGSGQIEMSQNVDAELSFRFSKTLLDPYVRLFEPRLSPYARAIASGSVRLVGQLANWDRLSASASIDALDVSLFDYRIQNDGPIRLAFDNNVVSVQQLRLAGKDTRLDVSGGVSLRDRRIGVKVSGDANLGILPVFFKDVRSAGRAVLRAEVNGSLSKPDFTGSAEITDGRIRVMSLPQSLQAINGRVAFAGDGIRLEDMTAQLAGGRVRFGGRVDLNGFTIGQLTLSATAENMEFRYPEGFRSTIDAQLDLVGTMAAPTLRGNVTVKSALYNKRVATDLTALVASARSSSAGGGGPAAVSVPLRFDVRIQAPSSLRIENNVAHLVSSADLVLRGTYDKPLLFGRAEVERGDAIFEGKRYLVRHGAIDFSNPTRIEPFVDLEGETLVRVPGQTYVVNVQLLGTLDRLDSQLTSDPPLSQLEILSLLFGGDTQRAEARDAELRTLQREESQRSLATSRLQQAAVGAVTQPVTGALEQAFGLDAFQITPNVGYDPYQRLTPTARLTVGKRISNKLYLTFSRSLNTPAGADQLILLEYDQNERLSWIFSRNEDGTYALDVRVRHVF
jgi:hypothetical protein